MLKKKSHSWTSLQTEAIRQLKKKMTSQPTIQIPSDGKRILQTDASDQYWGVVLLEEDNTGKRRIFGYKSGHFKDSQLHYHSFFKELLAIKMGIQKFEFHLKGHHFLVKTDFAASQRMLNNKKSHPTIVKTSCMV